MQDSPSVDERAQVLLKRLVEHYIAEGTPAASKVLAAQPGVQVSPATVRNIMGELESHGLVRSPHTSAGKIPTQQGLRFFVDSLLSMQPVNQQELDQLASQLIGSRMTARVCMSSVLQARSNMGRKKRLYR